MTQKEPAKTKDQQRTKRLLTFVKSHSQVFCTAMQGQANTRVLKGKANASLAVCAGTLKQLAQEGAIWIAEGKIGLLPAGEALLARLSFDTADENERFASQHRDLAQATIQMNGEHHTVTLNISESPLARLRKWRTQEGNPFLSDAAFAAGEKLRMDFTKGQMTPRVTASWDMTLISKKGQGGSNSATDMSDYALDARSRLNGALDALGPDLSGVVADVCCYLKGLECVERERRWPPRSEKILLRAGLELLARHYGMVARAPSRNGIRAL
ncbi:MAG: DUF6456 domain-containing protein [Pseudomonadota bacterium]